MLADGAGERSGYQHPTGICGRGAQPQGTERRLSGLPVRSRGSRAGYLDTVAAVRNVVFPDGGDPGAQAIRIFAWSWV